MAANDLGVLLAQCGHYADARVMLEQSLSLRQQSTGWQNLTVVYRQLGLTALAARAAQQATRLRQTEMIGQPGSSAWANDRVLWLDPRSFAQTSANAANPPGAIPGAGRVPPAWQPTRAAGPRRDGPRGRQRPAGRRRVERVRPIRPRVRRPRLPRPNGCCGDRPPINDELRNRPMKAQNHLSWRLGGVTCHPTLVPHAAFRPAGVGARPCGVLAGDVGRSGKGRSDGCGHSRRDFAMPIPARRASPQ